MYQTLHNQFFRKEKKTYAKKMRNILVKIKKMQQIAGISKLYIKLTSFIKILFSYILYPL